MVLDNAAPAADEAGAVPARHSISDHSMISAADFRAERGRGQTDFMTATRREAAFAPLESGSKCTISHTTMKTNEEARINVTRNGRRKA